MSWPALPYHRLWLAAETGRLLDFGRGARVDAGFGWLDVDGAVDSAQPLQLWITTRMTHVFALGHLLGVPGCGPLADHGLTSIRHSFEDRDHGGWFAEAGPAGPTRMTKEAYSHALPDYNRDDVRHRFRPFGVTPGHGLEWSRLLLQLHASCDAPPAWLIPAARALFARAVADGWERDGGFVYTMDFEGQPVVTDRLHWVLAEAIGAAAALRAVTDADDYDQWYEAFWDLADARRPRPRARQLAA